jgi:RNA polymerase sigma-70 factor (ECF subfamily)
MDRAQPSDTPWPDGDAPADALGQAAPRPDRSTRQWRSHLAMTTDRSAPSTTPDADELADCLEAIARSQDRAAFAVLFRHFAPRIKTYLLRHGASDGQAEDLAQDALVAVWRKAAQFEIGRAHV